MVDASGRAGGGKMLIGGDWGGGHPNKSLVNNPSAKLENFTIATATTVSVDAATTINASATERGNGGKVVLWSDSQTTFAGTILAHGRRARRRRRVRRDLEPRPTCLQRQCRCRRAARRRRHAAARSAGPPHQFGLQWGAELHEPCPD